MILDAINGSFELIAGFMVLLHCWRTYQDKSVKGVSFVATAFFVVWGYWNLIYYPALDQWLSFAGGILIVFANTLWIALMIYYARKEKTCGA